MGNRSVIYKSNVNMNSVGDPRVMTIEYMKDTPVVLDVGCACGDLGVALKEHRSATMHGLEYNQGSIDIALETGAYEEIHQFNLDEITEESFSQYKGKFDYIVCGDVLEHLRNPMYSLNILKSYLKEDGRIIASIPNVAHMSIKSNLLVNDFTYTPLGLLDETHIHLFTHKSIALGLSSIGLKVDGCKFTLQKKVAWQPNDPYPQLSDDMKDYLFKDWHSYVCQYVMSISPSEQNSEDLFNHNIKKLNIDETNAPENIKNYRAQILAELTNTTAQKLDNGLLALSEVKEKVGLSNDVCDEIKKSVGDVVQNQKDNSLLLKQFKNDVLNVRDVQVNNFEVIKGRFDELKSQNVVAENKLTSISSNQQNIQSTILQQNQSQEQFRDDTKNQFVSVQNQNISIIDKLTSFEAEIENIKSNISNEQNILNEKLVSLENTLSLIKTKNYQEISNIQQQLISLEQKIFREKEFDFRVRKLEKKIKKLKKRRRFYKKLLIVILFAFVATVYYLVFF